MVFSSIRLRSHSPVAMKSLTICKVGVAALPLIGRELFLHHRVEEAAVVDVARAEGIDHLDLVAGREIIAVLPRHDRSLVAQRKHHDARALLHHGAEVLFIFLAVAEELGVVELRADEYVDLRRRHSTRCRRFRA